MVLHRLVRPLASALAPNARNARTGHAPVGEATGPARLEARRLHGLWLCPPLLAVWANTHGGFLAGLAIYLVILGCRGLEYALSRRSDRRQVLTQLALVAAAGAAATLLNPYGLGLHRWLLEALSVPRPEIQEWHPPPLWATSSIKLWMLLRVAVWGLVCSQRPRDFTQLLVLSLVACEALQHQRHLPFLALLIAFWLSPHIDSAARRLWAQLGGSTRSIRLSPQAADDPGLRRCCRCVVCSWSASDNDGGKSRCHVTVIQCRRFSSCRTRSCTGNLVVAGSWAQYAIAVRGARLPNEGGVQVAFDGRFRTCYPQEVIDMHFDFFRGDGGPDKRYRSPLSPPADPQRILQFRQPEPGAGGPPTAACRVGDAAAGGGMGLAVPGPAGTDMGSSQPLRRTRVARLFAGIAAECDINRPNGRRALAGCTANPLASPIGPHKLA